MKPIRNRFFGLMKSTGEDGLAHQDGESRFFALPSELQAAQPEPEAWSKRVAEIHGHPLETPLGLVQLRKLWNADALMSPLGGNALERMVPYIQFHTLPPDREVIRQDELGDFLLVLLRGSISVVRKQEWGEMLVLAQVTPGEMLGEMSLLDGGERFSTCITRSECDIAVLTADGLDRMMSGEPRIAATLTTLLARKLSMRLRVVSARLGGRKS